MFFLCGYSQIHLSLKSSLTLRNCAFHSEQHDCIYVEGPNAIIKAESCRFYGSPQAGGSIGSATFVAKRCIFDSNYSAGIAFLNSDVTLLECAVYANKLSGVCATGEGRLVLEKCNVFHHKLNGVEVSSETECSVKNCRLR